MATTHTHRRMTKHELKTDRFTTSIFAAREWVEQNLKITLIVLGGAIVLGAAVWGTISWRAAAAREALSLYGEAGVEIRSGNPAVAIAQLQKLLDEHSGSPMAGPGCFQLAQLHFRQRSFDDARVLFRRYIDEFGSDPMLVSASWAGLGAVDEQAGLPAEAVDKYRQAYAADPGGFRAAEYLRTAIRAAVEANDSAKALEFFATLQKEFPEDVANLSQAHEALIEHGFLDPAKPL
jgi:tetratricopeptide (TPR) repeat protein